MAKTIHPIIVLLLLFNLLISTTMAVRDIPSDKRDDVKHPNMFFSNDHGYLIPGIGRGILPKSKKGFNPFTYNPVTGNNNGIPGFADVPTFGGVGSVPHVPGGDDTLVPNSKFEFSSTGGSGSTPVSARP